MTGQYKLMLAQQEVPTIAEKGYSGVFNIVQDNVSSTDDSTDDSTGTIITSVAKYD